MADFGNQPKSNPDQKKVWTRKNFLQFLTILPAAIAAPAFLGACGEMRNESQIQTIATAQASNPESIPRLPPGCDKTQVQIHLSNFSSQENKDLNNNGSGFLVRRQEITEPSGLTYEKYQFITNMHVLEGMWDPDKGFDSTLDAASLYTWQGPTQETDSKANLQLLSINQVYDGGIPRDIVIITARSTDQYKLSSEIKGLGTDRLHPWIENPLRVTVAGYPIGANVYDLMIAEVNTESIQPMPLAENSTINYQGDIQVGSNWFISGMSGSEICAETPDLPDGVVMGLGSSNSEIGGNTFGISTFPPDIQAQTEANWNAAP